MAVVDFYCDNEDTKFMNTYNCSVPKVNDYVTFRNPTGKNVEYKVVKVIQELFVEQPSLEFFDVHIINTELNAK